MIGGQRYEAEVCPGWLARQIRVVEGTQATMALKTGQLDVFFPDPPNPIVEAASAGLRAFNMYEADQIKQMKQKNS